MAICSFYGIERVEDLFKKGKQSVQLSETQLGLQRAINLLSVIRDGEFVGENDEIKGLSDNMKTEILYQLMERAENENNKKQVVALKWAILQIEKGKVRL